MHYFHKTEIAAISLLLDGNLFPGVIVGGQNDTTKRAITELLHVRVAIHNATTASIDKTCILVDAISTAIGLRLAV